MLRLPQLTVLQDINERKAITCASRPDRCTKCPAFKKNGGPCGGCNADKLKTCTQSICFKECDVCAGYKVHTPAICVKAPLNSAMMNMVLNGSNDWARPEYKYHPRKRIEAKSHAILMARGGGVKQTKGSPFLPEFDLIAATLIDVWGPRGWFSKDLKDYLRLLPHQKLMLVTAMRDHRLEQAWEHEMFGDESYRNVGIDYWAPLIFSTYHTSGNLHNYWSFLRTMYGIMRGKPHWTVLPSIPGLALDDYGKASGMAIKQAIFNAQFLTTDDRMSSFIAMLSRWDNVMPKDFPFWFVGMSTARFVHNVRKYLPARELFFVSANPFRLAGHGKQLFRDSRVVKMDHLAKEDLYYLNQKAFMETVETYAKRKKGDREAA